MDIQFGAFRNFYQLLYIISTIPVCIDSILKYDCLEISFTNERKVERKISCSPIGHCSNIPGGTLFTCECKILSYFSVDWNSFVECNRNTGNEIGTFLFSYID